MDSDQIINAMYIVYVRIYQHTMTFDVEPLIKNVL